MSVPFAVNYEEEYMDVGFNENGLKNLAERTNGVLFSPDNIDGIISKVQSDAKIKVLEKKDMDWYVLAAAMMLFLFEIFVRRLLQNRKNRG